MHIKDVSSSLTGSKEFALHHSPWDWKSNKLWHVVYWDVASHYRSEWGFPRWKWSMGKQEMGLEMLVKSSLSVNAPSFCFLPSHLVGLGIELRASCMQGKCSTTELHNPHPWFSKGFYRFPPTLQCCLGYQDQQWDIKKKLKMQCASQFHDTFEQC